VPLHYWASRAGSHHAARTLRTHTRVLRPSTSPGLPTTSVRFSPAWTSWTWRLLLLLAAALYVAGPLAAVATTPTVPGWLVAALGGLLVANIAVPAAGPAVLLGVVPLLPVLPVLAPAIPPALVHLVVLTQAIPTLVRLALRRTAGRGTPIFAVAWGLFVLVAFVSVGAWMTPDRLRASALEQVWRDLASQVPSYVFATRTTAEVVAIPQLATLADGLLCALVVYAAVTRETRRRYLVVAASGALATAAFGFVQAATGIGLQTAWQVFDPGIVRINATFVDPNALAAYYALVGPVILGLALGASGWRRIAWGGAFLVIVMAMVMTAGRIGLLSLGVACGVVAWLGLRRQLDAVDPWAIVRTRGRRIARAALVSVLSILAILAIAGTAFNVQHAQQTSYLHTWLYTLNLRQPLDAIAKGRLAVWQTTAAMMRDAPLTGVGLGMGVNEFERYRKALDVETLPEDARLSAHNTFLLVATDLGLLGLVVWGFVLGTVVVGVRAPGNAPAGDRSGWPMLGLAGGLSGLVVTMLTGDRILLAEDIVISTTCAALACVGVHVASRRWRWCAAALAAIVIVSWPLRVVTRTPTADAVPSPRGLYGPQVGENGEIYRWSSGYAVIYLPSNIRSITLPVHNMTPNTETLRIYLDGRLADERTLPHGPRTELTYEVPPNLRHGRWLRLTLEVEPTWQPPGDPRVLGILVGEWRTEPAADGPQG
jgi:O-antigen ligase